MAAYFRKRERLLCSFSRTLPISSADLKLLDVVGRPLPNEKKKRKTYTSGAGGKKKRKTKTTFKAEFRKRFTRK